MLLEFWCQPAFLPLVFVTQNSICIKLSLIYWTISYFPSNWILLPAAKGTQLMEKPYSLHFSSNAISILLIRSSNLLTWNYNLIQSGFVKNLIKTVCFGFFKKILFFVYIFSFIYVLIFKDSFKVLI